MHEWRPGTIGELARGVRGVSYRPEHLRTFIDANSVALIRATNIQDGQLDLADLQIVPKSIVAADQLIGEGDIAVCMSNGSKVLVGKSAQCKTRVAFRLTVGAFCSVFHPVSSAWPRFVGYAFQSDSFRGNIDVTLAGSAINNLRNSALEVFPCMIPPNEEQQRIAAVLDAVDAAIEKTAAVIAKLKHVRAGLLHDLLTRGLDDNGELRDPVKHPEQFKESPLGRIPKDWECQSLLDPKCTMWFSGGTPDRSRVAWWAGSVPFLTPKDMKAFRISDTIEHVTGVAAQHGSRLMPAETVFIVVRGMILAHTFPVCLSTRPFAFNQDVKAVQGGESLSTQFLGYWFTGNADLFLRKATEATHGTKKLDMSEINRVLIARPQLAEQDLLVHRIELADNLISENQSDLDALRQLKAGAMSDLLTGHVRVPENIEMGVAQ